ncbi:succinate-semialdehyde dehydrogenase/glutarate-semialdehyde dehydrogenase [Variovorax boronicumulans]|uniref:aldehyde dehydrogenase family protein n=1 Tax=Variovorax TaxID=34072 RepID=UPI002784CAE5|nr:MULTISPECIES: aldehyde dehydrogenase family protein [Variovorax]MDQ0038857.1 succinate-semialdehyde dehydrogenase/glutarate-semialdehyde dehydrogenase [Variovorax boronicumulans]MDQ0610836.1 acyl-CoA reductase-like NAD-dependent aldehyde dehydrogenase [Variovorax sp. W1I1]
MSEVETGNYIGGRWSTTAETMPVVNPANGETIATVPRSSRETANEAVAAAQAAAFDWAATPVFERAALCMAIATEIDARREPIAYTLSLEQGKVLAEARGEVAKAADGFRLAAELIKQMGGQTLPAEDPGKLVMTIRQPRGVYGVITPWNFPVNIPVEYLAPAIATGNTVVWVPAPSTALVACALMAAMQGAGLPAGVVNLVIGEGATVGDAVVAHPDVTAIAFTGSTATGRQIAERGAGKPMLLELGGNGPLIVFEDADLDAAAAAAAGGAFFNAGQVCAATGFVLAHASVVERLCEKLVVRAADQVLGNPLHPATTMGPLNNAKVAAKVRAHVDEAVAQGARLLHGGRARPDLGSDLFFEPTVMRDVTPDMLLCREETFGPVVPVVAFEDEAQALALALQNAYGLSVGVFTKDIGRGIAMAKKIPAGIVNINAGTTWWEIHLPFGGGSGKKSGIGRLGGMHTLDAMSEVKMITVTLPG